MITKVINRSKLKQLFLELFLNKTDKVSDVSDNSVTNAVAYGVAVVGQKCLKDISIVESQIFPDSATGSYLDSSAELFGVPGRKGALQSSTYLRIIAEPGTFYDKSIVTFNNYNGVRFIPEEDLTVGDLGFGYIKVRSESAGAFTNVEPNSIISISGSPNGHIAVTNEYMAIGGRDVEDDEDFRKRIKKHNNIVARYTTDYYTEILRQFSDNILRIINLGVDDDGKKSIGIVTQNGMSLQEPELDELLNKSKKYFGITDINRFGDIIGIKFVNVDWHFIGDPLGDGTGRGIDFRVQLWEEYSVDEVRMNIQINISKYLDFKNWEYGKKVEWDDLLQIVKDTKGVRYVPDKFFFPNNDEIPSANKLPRVKKFIMRDLNGNIIADSNNVITPIFYSV